MAGYRAAATAAMAARVVAAATAELVAGVTLAAVMEAAVASPL